MTASSASQAFVDAGAAMVQQHDTADTLTRLLGDCAALTGAAAVGLLVKDAAGRLDVLSATSHQAIELEIYQLQHDNGPCVDAIRNETALFSSTDEDITSRWGVVGEAIVAAGFHAVHAVPLRWHGRLIGAINTFHTNSATIDEEAQQLTQAFADVATVVIVQSAELTVPQLDERIRAALIGRTVIEQAKGVLAQTNGLDMAGAYHLLLQRATSNGTSLTATAAEILAHAQLRP